MCYDSCLLKSIHSFENIHIDKALVVEYVQQVILVDDLPWYSCYVKFHILWIWERIFEVKTIYIFSSQYSDMVYFSFNVWSRCCALSSYVYLMEKSSTTRVKMVSLVSCCHRPEVWRSGWYPNGARWCMRALCAMITACLRPYIPLKIFT